MPTPISNATPYATAAQLLSRYDERVVGDLCSDGKSKPTHADLVDSTTTAGGKLYAALQDASGDVETACMVGGRYSAADLVALTGNGAATLQRLVSDLAMDYVARRRADPGYQVSVQVQQARGFLDALSEGDRIFGLQEVADAGLEETDVETRTIVEDRKLVSFTAGRLFGTRNNRRG